MTEPVWTCLRIKSVYRHHLESAAFLANSQGWQKHTGAKHYSIETPTENTRIMKSVALSGQGMVLLSIFLRKTTGATVSGQLNQMYWLVLDWIFYQGRDKGDGYDMEFAKTVERKWNTILPTQGMTLSGQYFPFAAKLRLNTGNKLHCISLRYSVYLWAIITSISNLNLSKYGVCFWWMLIFIQLNLGPYHTGIYSLKSLYQ